MYTFFFFTNSSVLLSVFECLHISFFSLNHTFITTCCSSWTHPGFWEVQWFFLFFFLFFAAFWGLFFLFCFLLSAQIWSSEIFVLLAVCHCASSSGWPNRPKLSKSSSFGFFFFFFLVFLPLGCVWVYRDIFVHRLLFLLFFFFFLFFFCFLLSSIIVRYQRRPIQR